jgi:SPP1 gp7 family putative phage head morphogenesis protein
MSLEADMDAALDPMLMTFRGVVEARIADHLIRIYLSGAAEMITWGKTKGGIPIAFEGPPVNQAIDYARARAGTLIKNMDIETKERLRAVVSNGIKQKRGIPGLARDLQNEMGDMTRKRALTIARTETNDALSQAFLDRSKAMGVPGKEWITFGPCPICAANGGDGIIPMDQSFSSGDDRPPAHPNCVCALAPSMTTGS